MCPPRYYCVNKNHADPCPRGRVCGGATGFNMTLCPRGTYSNVEMLQDVTECTPCDPGSYCGAPGLTAVSGLCSAGYYCHSGVDTPAPSNNNTGLGGMRMVQDLFSLVDELNTFCMWHKCSCTYFIFICVRLCLMPTNNQ